MSVKKVYEQQREVFRRDGSKEVWQDGVTTYYPARDVTYDDLGRRCDGCAEHAKNRERVKELNNGEPFCKSCFSFDLNENKDDFVHKRDCPWAALLKELDSKTAIITNQFEKDISNRDLRIAELEAEIKTLRGDSLTIKRTRMMA